MCLLLSLFEGLKWAVFSPEQDPPDDFYDDLCHMYAGKNTQPFYANQMPENEYLQAMDFIKDHFFYIFPDTEIPTQEYINLRFEDVILKHNVAGCIIDPYNQLDNDLKKSGGREDQYISSFLTIQKRFAQKYDIFMFIVAHPKGTLSKSGGNYECPNVYDLSGGAMWNNKCDNIICIYRPLFTTDPQNSLVKFISQKIKKQKLNGRPGEAELSFDIASMRYYEKRGDDNKSPFEYYHQPKQLIDKTESDDYWFNKENPEF
jgi:twinkle protein